jgi:NhaP-type Na+/H+ and K+/H+ antiporter
MVVLGLGIGWIVLDLLKKIEVWQGQVAIFLGLAGLIICLVVFTGAGAIGAFAIGVGVAIFMWGMLKKEKKEEEKN